MKQKLKPCPFCGEQPMVSEKSQSVYCKNSLCPEVIAGESDNIVDAIEGWNTRTDHRGKSVEIFWEQRRYELIKEFVSSHLIGSYKPADTHIYIGNSIAIADELINQLKQHKDER